MGKFEVRFRNGQRVTVEAKGHAHAAQVACQTVKSKVVGVSRSC